MNRHQKRERGRRLRAEKLHDWALKQFGALGALCACVDIGFRPYSISNCRATKRRIMAKCVPCPDPLRKLRTFRGIWMPCTDQLETPCPK